MSVCVCVLLCPREVGSAAERCGSVVVAKGTAANQRCGGCEAQSLTTLLNLTADAVDLGIATRVRSLGALCFWVGPRLHKISTRVGLENAP